jgi:predicted DNA-binding transcriptional regulator AlpA
MALKRQNAARLAVQRPPDDAPAEPAETNGKPHKPRYAHRARAPPPPLVRLLSKAEVVAITNVSYVTLWKWMRNGEFPLPRVAGGQSKWLSSEIDQWLIELPIRPLKAPDEPPNEPPAKPRRSSAEERV